MAKIIKMGSQNITPNKIANPFKTSRTSTTNPFKYQNFEGTTLPVEICADVFGNTTNESAQKANKLKMIASSVAGSMEKIGRGITEPIVNFVKRVNESVVNAWDYAKNTNITSFISDLGNALNKPIEIKGLNGLDELLHKPIEIKKTLNDLSDSLSNTKSHISARVNDFGKDLGNMWAAMIEKLPTNNHIKSGLSVAEYEEMWKNEIALSNKEVA